MNRTIMKIRKINSSLAFLLAVLFGIASSVVFLVEKLLIQQTNPFAEIPVFEGSQLSVILAYFFAVFYKFEIFFVILSLLSLVSLIFFYVSNRVKTDEKKPIMITKPFAIFKTIEILSITGFYIYATYFIVNSVLDIIFNQGFTESTSATSNFIYVTILLVLYVVIFILLVTYYSKMFKTITCIKKTVKTGVIMGRVSSYVIFLNFVLFASFVAWAVFCISSNESLLIAISKIFMAVSFLLFALYLLKLRKATLKIVKKGGENEFDDEIDKTEFKIRRLNEIREELEKEDETEISDEEIIENPLEEIEEEFVQNFEEIK